MKTKIKPRERKVWVHIVAGLKLAAIGPLLGVSPRTVEKDRHNLKAKLNVRDTAGLVRAAATADFFPA